LLQLLEDEVGMARCFVLLAVACSVFLAMRAICHQNSIRRVLAEGALLDVALRTLRSKPQRRAGCPLKAGVALLRTGRERVPLQRSCCYSG